MGVLYLYQGTMLLNTIGFPALERETGMLSEDITKEEQGELVLANIVEELVKQTVGEVISKMDMCTCDICKLNACAIALNNIKPKYVTTTRGKLLAKIITEKMHYHTEVLVEVTKALLQVKEHPLH